MLAQNIICECEQKPPYFLRIIKTISFCTSVIKMHTPYTTNKKAKRKRMEAKREGVIDIRYMEFVREKRTQKF